MWVNDIKKKIMMNVSFFSFLFLFYLGPFNLKFLFLLLLGGILHLLELLHEAPVIHKRLITTTTTLSLLRHDWIFQHNDYSKREEKRREEKRREEKEERKSWEKLQPSSFSSFIQHKMESMATEADRQYFESYEDIESHEIMLKDRPRNKSYLRALELANLEGKVVLDIGAGAAAFLSMIAARCGARKVYAVEASGMADNAEAIVQHNGYSDVVQVIKGRIEDVVLPEKVDVIVSEWMGFYLLHESMLNSVLLARDRLVPSLLSSSSCLSLVFVEKATRKHNLFSLCSFSQVVKARWNPPSFNSQDLCLSCLHGEVLSGEV
jgi:2-polyprenyl-3-methyl-5-hydroxy-6-metoxy-1,4-benzoquinol methylase